MARSQGFRAQGGGLLNFAYEANALPSNCANERLVLATVADGFSCGVDAAGQCRIRHDPAAPDRRDEVILGNDAAAVLNQIDQEVEYLRLDGDALRTTAQFPPISNRGKFPGEWGSQGFENMI